MRASYAAVRLFGFASSPAVGTVKGPRSGMVPSPGVAQRNPVGTSLQAATPDGAATKGLPEYISILLIDIQYIHDGHM